MLISTSFRGLSPFYRRLLPANYPGVIKSLIFRQNTPKNEFNNLKLVSSMIRSPAEQQALVSRWISYSQENPVSPSNGSKQLAVATRYKLDTSLPRPTVPILVLRGMKDRMVSPSCSEALARHWQLSLETHPYAGHDIPLDDPAWVCERIRAWYLQIR